MKPSVGGIVHYVSYGTPGGEYGRECRAAVVTELSPNLAGGTETDHTTVRLFVMNPAGIFHDICPQDEIAKAGGTWHWPEREED